MSILSKLFYTLFYLRRPPWDTRVSPPELLEFIAAHPPGRALDLGCGAGTNAITLAQHGWQAVGVDFVGKAIRMARRRAQEANVRVDFRTGDVTRLEGIHGPFDLALDIGCFHSLRPEDKARYAHNLDRLLAPGGTFLLYAFLSEAEPFADLPGLQSEPGERSPDQPVQPRRGFSVGVTPHDLMLFEDRLTLQDRQDGFDRQRTASWFTYIR